MKGTVKFFNDMKGFGFIAGEDGNEYFVHMSGLKPGVAIKDNDAVVFDVGQGDRGPKAENVELDTGAPAEEAPAAEEAPVEEEAPAEEPAAEEEPAQE